MDKNTARCLERTYFLRATPPLLPQSMAAGLALSIMATFDICTGACSDTHSYVIFGFGLGWFGIAFFSCALVLCVLRSRSGIAANIFPPLIFAAAGAEFNFIRVQKYELGIWCPICLTIAAVVFCAVFLLLFERTKQTGFRKRKAAIGLVAFLLGFSCAFFGVKQDISFPHLVFTCQISSLAKIFRKNLDKQSLSSIVPT